MGINNSSNISFKKIKTMKIQKSKSIIVANNKYIVSYAESQSSKITDINTNLFKIIEYNSMDLILKFHPKFENIFLLAEENNIKIYEFIKDKCEERVHVTGHSKPIIAAVFSNTEDKIFATYSKDNTIKIWNLENPFCICNISVINIITEMQIYKNFIFYYDNAENCIIQYD